MTRVVLPISMIALFLCAPDAQAQQVPKCEISTELKENKNGLMTVHGKVSAVNNKGAAHFPDGTFFKMEFTLDERGSNPIKYLRHRMKGGSFSFKFGPFSKDKVLLGDYEISCQLHLVGQPMDVRQSLMKKFKLGGNYRKVVSIKKFKIGTPEEIKAGEMAFTNELRKTRTQIEELLYIFMELRDIEHSDDPEVDWNKKLLTARKDIRTSYRAFKKWQRGYISIRHRKWVYWLQNLYVNFDKAFKALSRIKLGHGEDTMGGSLGPWFKRHRIFHIEVRDGLIKFDRRFPPLEAEVEIIDDEEGAEEPENENNEEGGDK